LNYWAHSDPDGRPPGDPAAKWQRLSVHLENVAGIAGELAHAARPDDSPFRTAAELAGRLHDFGKYTDCFQKMILTKEGRCQHSGHGAVLAHDNRYLDAAIAIAGHHAGIPDRTGGAGTLDVRIKESRQEAELLRVRASEDCPALSSLFNPPTTRDTNLTRDNFDLHTRMLFSCLVDADRLDSGGQFPLQAPLDPAPRLAVLQAYIQALAAAPGDPVVKKARRQVLDDCLNAAPFPERLLSLTVPTGGGKTLSSMAFALRRAALSDGACRRIIVVIPYLSIIDQNAEVYSRVFGPDAILEHHSGSFDRLRQGADNEHFIPASPEKEDSGYSPGALRPATENWDAPLIVTTSVRFFESLFSNRPSDLRRVHNIARSIVILDEVQTLPRRLLAPLLKMIGELSEHWGCTFVFSTATQPAFEKPAEAARKDARWTAGKIREIIAEPAQLQTALKRVTIEWELERTVGWSELAARIVDHPRVLCVVNLRDHAGALFDRVLALTKGTGEECFHLSTRMCAAHRLKILARIKGRLDQRLPCRVISTQLIEAGVDLDFDVAFRAVGPLDAVLQAAGRADREGILTARAGRPAGRLIVFRPEDERTPPNEYKEATGLTLAMAREALQLGQSIQPDSMERMRRYWNRYYGDCDQGQGLQDHRMNARFRTLAEEFEMISNRTLDAFVPYDDQARSAIDELRSIGLLTKELRQKLRRYTVGLQPYEFEKAKGVLEKIGNDGDIWVAVDRAYSESKGLKLELDDADNII
jgi:CRISPR-associated endonuclease/helicase Cas3